MMWKSLRVVIEVEGEPAFGGGDVPVFTLGVVGDLVFFDFADGEVFGLGVGEIEAAHRGAGVHGEAFGEFDSGIFFRVQ